MRVISYAALLITRHQRFGLPKFGLLRFDLLLNLLAPARTCDKLYLQTHAANEMHSRLVSVCKYNLRQERASASIFKQQVESKSFKVFYFRVKSAIYDKNRKTCMKPLGNKSWNQFY